jgi:hypothetical protein
MVRGYSPVSNSHTGGLSLAGCPQLLNVVLQVILRSLHGDLLVVPQSECMLCMVTRDPLHMGVLDFLNVFENFCSGRLMLQKIVQYKMCEVYHYYIKIKYETFITGLF